MEYCSPLWAGAPASHLSRLHAVETKAFRIIGISRDEAESLGLSLSLSPQAGRWSFCLLPSPLQPRSPPAVSVTCPHHISAGRSMSANNPLLLKLPKSRITAHLHSFIPLFSRLWNKLPDCSIPFFPPGLQSSCSPPPLIIPHPNPRSFLPPLIHPKPTSFKFPAFLPESPCNVHLVFPMFPTPSLSVPQIS